MYVLLYLAMSNLRCADSLKYLLNVRTIKAIKRHMTVTQPPYRTQKVRMKWNKLSLYVLVAQALDAFCYTVPPGSPGFYHGNSTAAVTFDSHSLFLDDKRLYVFSGEVHPWRMPSGKATWRDVFQKMKVWKSSNSLLCTVFIPFNLCNSGRWLEYHFSLPSLGFIRGQTRKSEF